MNGQQASLIAKLLESIQGSDPRFPVSVDEMVRPNRAASALVGAGVRSRQRLVEDVFQFVLAHQLRVSNKSIRVRLAGPLSAFATKRQKSARTADLVRWVVLNSPAVRGSNARAGRCVNGARGIRAFVSVFTLPSEPESIWLDAEEDGSTPTPCDIVLGGPASWSAPRHADVGDVCFFYCSKRSIRNVQLLRQRLSRATRITKRSEDFLARAERQAFQLAGKIIAYAFVSARAHSDERESPAALHWKNRTLAPMTGGRALEEPIGLLQFRGELPVPHGQTIMNLTAVEFRKLLGVLANAGNELDSRLVSVVPTGVGRVRVTRGNWRNTGCHPDHRFANEHEVRGDFIDHLLYDLRDEKSDVHEEVECSSFGRSKGRVDYLVAIHGVYVPVEAKLNVRAEDNLVPQMRRYLSSTEFIVRSSRGQAATRAARSKRGLVIDADGIYVLNARGYVDCKPGEPCLRRREIAALGRGELRKRLRRVLRVDNRADTKDAIIRTSS